MRAAIYSLRGGFLIRPLLIALALGTIGAVLSESEEAFPILSAWVPQTLFPSRADPQIAQVILASIATSIMTVVSIVFAILLMTLTLASTQFSPRILVSFVRDQITQWTLGIFLGTFTYCMAALPAARALPTPFNPVATVIGAMILALLCVAWLIFFIHHISHSISVNHIVDRIATETEQVIDALMPNKRVRPWQGPSGPVSLDDPRTTILSTASGYIRFVDTARLLAIAKNAKIQVHILRRVGHFIAAGVPLVVVGRSHRLSPETQAAVLATFDIGPARTLQQDVEFGLIQIADIALKAISPAINDPSTAVTCLDQLGRIVIRWMQRDLPVARYFDPPHVLRVAIEWQDLPGVFATAFEQIRHYAEGDLPVSARLLRVTHDMIQSTSDPAIRAFLSVFAERVVTRCALRLDATAMQSLNDRLDLLRADAGR